MRLEGIHHITAITADAPGNVDFYARVLGLRMVKQTVNFDAPDVYHLYYADELGSPGAILTFFEFPGAPRGRAGDGMVHRLAWRVASPESLDFWAQRLRGEGVPADRHDGELRFTDPEGLGLAMVVNDRPDADLAADAGEVPPENALLGFDGVRAFARRPGDSASLLERALDFSAVSDGRYEVVGAERRARCAYDAPPAEPGREGAGTVHHIAWSAQDDAELEGWRARLSEQGARPTPIIDRTYFHSVYFREPSGVLFELATRAPGFTVDEPAERLGESLQLPPRYEAMREQLQRTLVPLVNPRVP